MPIALVLFALAAAGGLTMLVRGFQEKESPTLLVVGHGALAATALALALVAVGGSAGGLAVLGLGILVLAALGGFTVLFLHRKRGRLPLSLAVVHGLLAVSGFLLLLIWVLTA